MAGRNDPHKGGKKNSAADQEQEEEVEVEAKEPERDRRQDQLGNQAIASMIGAGLGTADGGGGGAGLAMRQADVEQEGVDYGGDDEPDTTDINFEEALFAEAWRPRTRKSEQKARFAEAMPDDDLPPVDTNWVAAVRRAPAPSLQAARGIEALVQPSSEVVAQSLAQWIDRSFAWGQKTVLWRCLAHTVLPPAPGTVDPFGRVLPTRARGGAIAVAALLASATLRADATPATGALMLFDLELRARQRRMMAHADAAIDLFAGSLPYAAKLFEVQAPSHGARLRPRQPNEDAVHVILEALLTLTDLVDPMGLLPVLSDDDEGEDEDDPLGIQAVIEAHTGGKAPPAHRDAAVKAAERLAEQAAIGRVQGGAVATVVAEVADLWVAGPPRRELLHALTTHDQRVQEVLTLLVDIARAATTGQVGPAGLSRGLKRAATAMRRDRHELIATLAHAAGSVLPEGAVVYPPRPVPDDPLSDAWADGRPVGAISWLEATLHGWERAAAVTLTKLGAGELGLGDEIAALCSDSPPEFRDPLEILRDAAMLYEGRPDAIDPGPRAARGLACRNGLLVAEAAITTLEAQIARGELGPAEAHRATVGSQLYHLGSHAGFALLARWSPPEEDEAS